MTKQALISPNHLKDNRRHVATQLERCAMCADVIIVAFWGCGDLW